jgi:Uncharacterized alpha/beta hydrolase domain (DUF2235)
LIQWNQKPALSGATNLGYKLWLGPQVQYCFHAVAMDEKRDAFRDTRVDNGYQVWFRGVHSDIGGGNENPGLSNLTLASMLRKAKAVGLPVKATLADQLACNRDCGIKPAQFGLATRFREIKATDRVHYSVTGRQTRDCQNAPAECLVESVADESGRIVKVGETH